MTRRCSALTGSTRERVLSFAGRASSLKTRSRRSTLRRGGLLLEVLLSLIICAVVLGTLGSEMISGLQLVQAGDQRTRAGELADRMLALLELDQNLVQRVFVDQEQQGDFGEQYPEYFWRLELEPTEVLGLGQLKLDILYNPEGGGADNARVVQSYAMLKAEPGRINLEEDFGIDLTQLGPVGDLLPTLGLDPTNFNPQVLASLPPEQLMALLPQLLPLIQQMLGGAGLSGSGAGGEFTMDDLLKLQEQLGGEGGPLAGGPLPGGPGGAPGAGGIPQGGTGPNGEWTVEDLLDLQEKLTGERGPSGPPGAGAGAPGGGRGPGGRFPGGGRGPGMGGGPGADGMPGGGGRPGAGGQPGAGGRPGAGRGPAGGAPAGGTGPDGEWTLEDLLDLQEKMTGERGPGGAGGGAQPPAPPRGGAQPPAPPRNNPPANVPPANNPTPPRNNPTPPAGGNPPIIQPSGVDENGNPQYTIEDLLRLREELIRRGEGGGG